MDSLFPPGSDGNTITHAIIEALEDETDLAHGAAGRLAGAIAAETHNYRWGREGSIVRLVAEDLSVLHAKMGSQAFAALLRDLARDGARINQEG